MKRLADLGERSAIQRIVALLTKGKNPVGIGDDCAVIPRGNDYVLVTTDMMFQRTHIPVQMTPYQMGWSLVAINLSDIAAKGGTPLGVVCSLGLPKKTSELFLKKLVNGANACAVKYGTRIIGGDTKETREITLCGTAVGTVKKDEFMARTGAHPGDVVAVTGTLGKAGAGYYVLKYHCGGKTLSKAFLEPQPRIAEGRQLARQQVVTSSMDLSDGLSASLYQLQELNAVGFEIMKDALPLASELGTLIRRKHDLDPYSIALHFGGDYELLVTMPKKAFTKTKKTMKTQGFHLIAIGAVTKNKDMVLLDKGTKLHLENKGYEHFKSHQLS